MKVKPILKNLQQTAAVFTCDL